MCHAVTDVHGTRGLKPLRVAGNVMSLFSLVPIGHGKYDDT
jgi:hypothetical protein